MTDFSPKTGYVDLREVYKEPQTTTLNIMIDGVQIHTSLNNPDFVYSQIINCNFLNNYAASYAAVYGY